MPTTDTYTQDTFKHRVAKFWKAFEEEESQVREMMDHKAQGETLLNFVDNILQIAFNKVYFEMGINKDGKYELILTPEGDKVKLIQLYYWLQYAPQHLSEKWNFYAAKPGKATKGAAMDMYGVRISEDDLTIYVDLDKEKKKVNLEVYAPTLMKLEENQYYSMFFIFLDQFIGETFTMEYVGYIDFVAEKTNKEPIAISKLKGTIESAIAKYNWHIFDNPCETYVGYSMKPIENEDWKLREDIFSGYTSCTPILNAYYSDDKERVEEMKEDGIIFGFLFFENLNIAKDEVVNFRSGIEDKILDETMERGIANGLGGATGFHFSYMDFVIYDITAFLSIARNVLDKYDFEEAGFSEFIRGGQPIFFK